MPRIHPLKKYNTIKARCESEDAYTNEIRNGTAVSFKAILIDDHGNTTLPVRAVSFNPKDELAAKVEALKNGEIFVVLGEVKMAVNSSYSDDLIIKDINPAESHINDLPVENMPNDDMPF